MPSVCECVYAFENLFKVLIDRAINIPNKLFPLSNMQIVYIG